MADDPTAVPAALLTELRERFAPDTDPREIQIYLAARGYDARRIGAILEALRPQRRPRPAAERPAVAAWTPLDGPPLRAPSAHERSRFAPEAWGLLLDRQAALGWSPAELEHIIERTLMHIDGRVALDDLRALLDGAGVPDGSGSDSPTVH